MSDSSSLIENNDRVPSVNVLIAAHQAESTIQAAVDSVVAQTYAHWSISIVDDGSRDATWEKLLEIASSDDRIHVEQIHHSGVSVTRNRLLETSRGEFIFFLDADDVLETTALDDLVSVALKDNSDVVLGRTTRVTSSKSYELPEVVKSGIYELKATTFVSSPELVHSLGAANKLIKRELAQVVTFENSLATAEDQPWLVAVYLAAAKISTAKRPTYRWIQSNDPGARSLSSQVRSGDDIYFSAQLRSLQMSLHVIENSECTSTDSRRLQIALLQRSIVRDLVPGVVAAIQNSSNENLLFIEEFVRVLNFIQSHDLGVSLANELADVVVMSVFAQRKANAAKRNKIMKLRENLLRLIDVKDISETSATGLISIGPTTFLVNTRKFVERMSHSNSHSAQGKFAFVQGLISTPNIIVTTARAGKFTTRF